MAEETFKVVVPLGAGAVASAEGASEVVVVGAAESVAGAGGDEGSDSGEEEGLVELELELESGEAADEEGVLELEPLLEDLGVEAGAELPLDEDVGGDALGDPVDDDGAGDDLFEPEGGEALGELPEGEEDSGLLAAETEPTRATKTRAKMII